MDITTQKYDSDLKTRDEKAIQKNLEQKTEKIVNQEVSDYTIKKAEIESQRKEELSDLLSIGKTEEEVNEKYDTLIAEATSHFKERIAETLEEALPAPTEIIYRIAISFILGFDENATERKHNFRMLDALPYAKEGTLENKLDEVFD